MIFLFGLDQNIYTKYLLVYDAEDMKRLKKEIYSIYCGKNG